MENELIKQIREHYGDYKAKIVESVGEYVYRKKRYDVDYTVALFLSDEPLDEEFIRGNIRDTDRVFSCDENCIGVIYDFANEETGLKAAENLLMYIEPHLKSDTIYISVVNSHCAMDESEHARRTLDLLIENIKNGFKDIPELPSC